MPWVNKKLEKEFYRKRWAKNRSEFFGDKKCKWCSSVEKLELHHLDPSTKISSVIWSWAPERRLAEIEKCIVLCTSCHREYHASLRRKPHGTRASYTRGCRCQECKQAMAICHKDYMKRKKSKSFL